MGRGRPDHLILVDSCVADIRNLSTEFRDETDPVRRPRGERSVCRRGTGFSEEIGIYIMTHARKFYFEEVFLSKSYGPKPAVNKKRVQSCCQSTRL